MTAEEIKKVIRRAFTRHMVQHVQVARGDVRDRVDLFIDEATDELLTEFASHKDAWIKVSDRLPDNGMEIDMYIPDWVSPVAYGEFDGCFNAINSIGTYESVSYNVKPSHWKLRPTPPND